MNNAKKRLLLLRLLRWPRSAGERLSSLFRRIPEKVRFASYCAALVALMTLLVSHYSLTSLREYRPGDVVKADVVVPADLQVVDERATAERQRQARDRVPLSEELALAEDLLSIERVRFGDRLRVVEDVEAGLDDVPVPGLLFQPLVENAVRYAVAPRAEGGTVWVRVRRDPGGETFTTEIADDGPGFLPGAPPLGNGVGLESVRERVRLGGPGHGFALESAPGGTRVRVTLPLASAVPARSAGRALAPPNGSRP